VVTHHREQHGTVAALAGELTRRSFVIEGGGALAASSLAGRALKRTMRRSGLGYPHPSQYEALRVLGRSSLRLADSLPNASIAAGTDTLPEIEHVVVLMLENHSYDNFLGMLGRGPDQTPRGDGFTLAADGYPSATNPDSYGGLQRAFQMPTTCQLSGKPSQEWEACHIQYANGTNRGFVISPSGPVAMGYWTGAQLPFTYDLASKFPIGDRWFCSCLAQTDPNRRFLIAGTSNGMVDDIGTGPNSVIPDATFGVPPAHGTIGDRFDAHGITWTVYCAKYPIGDTFELYPSDSLVVAQHKASFDQFFTDAAAGNLPSFSLVDPDYGTQSQEDPQNIVLGERVIAQVVHAVGASPKWRSTILIITYDEHGGYYDHVPPPAALAPDSVAPQVQIGEAQYDGFARYGFRVPSVVVSPYAKTNYVSHVVYDHTSILAFVERKWNLPAMTLRDANANHILDFLDTGAMAKRKPTFPELPKLAAAGDTAAALACSASGPGTIPPTSAPPPIAIRVELRSLGVSKAQKGLVVTARTDIGSTTAVTLELFKGARRVASHKLGTVSATQQRVVLRVHGRAPTAGHYTVIALRAGKRVAKLAITIR
jgi:phospholipase C